VVVEYVDGVVAKEVAYEGVVEKEEEEYEGYDVVVG
jgi:hypothetical protein